MFNEEHVLRVLRHSRRAMLFLALTGPNEAKHKFAVARALEPIQVEWRLKGVTRYDKNKVARRAKWIYDRLIRLQNHTTWKLKK